MARPAQVKRLTTGQLIDTQEGFVDTFNYLVDFAENLMGEGNLDKGKTLVIDRTFPESPVIRGGGGGSDLIAGDDTNIVFTKQANGKIKVDVYYV